MLKLTFEMYKKVFFLIFFGYIKTENNYYLSYQEIFWREARERYQNLSKEEKYSRRKKAQGRYWNVTEEEKEKRCKKFFSEEPKQKIVQYRKKYCLTHNR